MSPECKGTSLLTEKVVKKLEELTNYRRNISWKFFQGSATGASKFDFDDSSWEQIKIPTRIDVSKGEVWLRTKIVVPEYISDIETTGSDLTIQSSVITHKTEIYVNSEKIMYSEYWTELRSPRILLDKKTEPGKEYVIVIHIFPKYEPVDVPVFNIFYSKVEKIAFELDSFLQELRFAEVLDKNFTERVSKEFDLKVFDKNTSAVINEIEKARSKLTHLSQKAKTFKVHLVSHAHIDINWLWPWADTVNTIKNTFSTMIKILDQHPSFNFSQSQALTYKITEEEFPALFKRIKQYVEKGKWDITASMWVESDLNMSGTEALIRQFFEAKRYIREKFGVEPTVCWQPDTFGHIWTMPQIMKKAGCKYYFFSRCAKEIVFQWESPDGSRVLAFSSPYDGPVTPKRIMDLVINLFKRYGLKTSMFVYGVGDHGGGATLEDIESACNLQKKICFPEIVFSTTHRYFKDLENDHNFMRIPVVKDELQFVFDGCYTTHGDIKRYNRLCETLLVDAEKLSVISGDYRRDVFRNVWQKALVNQFHDILGGSGTAEAYEYPFELAEETIRTANTIIDSSLKKISEKIGYTRSGIPIIVFNTLPWRRRDVVKVKVPKSLIPHNPIVVTSDGEDRSFVQINGDEILFVANLPSMGYRTYYLVEAKEPDDSPLIAKNEAILENEYLRLEIDSISGTFESLYDKIEQRFVFKKSRYSSSRPVFNNLLQVLHELPHNMSAWIIGEVSHIDNLIRGGKIELLEAGKIRSTIKITRFYKKSKIIQYISLYKGLPRIDLRTVIDWKEVADENTEAPMIKVAFTPILGISRASFEIPFGYIERVADGTEVPALNWVDLSDEEYGVSILNDSKYGFDVKGNTIRMTLIRTSYSPDPTPDQKLHEINYYIYPHKKSWKEALTFRRGYEINCPLKAYVVTNKPISKDVISEEYSFIQVKPENVVISCIKLAEDSDDYVLRLYDATGSGAEVELSFGFEAKGAYECDILERTVQPILCQESSLRFQMQPFEIKTLRVKHK
ncbi:MAG: glycoside hydrolase family 38 C-terminal domain-containing protein [Candidatus Jordarchaeaceae archaeon]